MLNYKILIKLFVLSHVLIGCVNGDTIQAEVMVVLCLLVALLVRFFIINHQCMVVNHLKLVISIVLFTPCNSVYWNERINLWKTAICWSNQYPINLPVLISCFLNTSELHTNINKTLTAQSEAGEQILLYTIKPLCTKLNSSVKTLI